MYYLTQICKVAIVVFFAAVVAVLFSTLTGCRGCSQQDEVVRWIPARDTIPELDIKDSLCVDEPVSEEVVVNTVTPKVKRKPSSPKPKQKKTGMDKASFHAYYDQTTVVHPWSEEFNLDSIKLTIIVPDMEMQITQNLN